MPTPKWLHDRLCGLSYADRIPVCQQLLGGSLTSDEKAAVWHFLAHAYRQETRPDEALSVCAEALAEDLPPDRLPFIVENQAMALYDLGRLDEIPQACYRLKNATLPASILGHLLAIKACRLSLQRSSAAFLVFDRAMRIFKAGGYVLSESWMQRSAASLALKLEMPKEARRWAEMITYEPAVPQAHILIARSYYQEGDTKAALLIAAQVMAGDFGIPASDDRAWISCLEGECFRRYGDLVGAGAKLISATKEIAQLRRTELDLQEAVNNLRMSIRRGEVA